MQNTKKRANLITYLHIIVKWRRFLIINTLLIGFLVACFSLLMPRSYRATSTLLPPTDETASLGVSSILSNLSIGGLGGLRPGALSDESYIFLAILNSKTVRESVVNKFDLITKYNSKHMEEAIRTLSEKMSIDINEDGTITLSVETATPYIANKSDDDEARVLAKDITDFMMQELDHVNRQHKTQKAHNTRLFIEKRYMQNLNAIKLAEEEFRSFQEAHGTIALQEQTSAMIEIVSALKAQIIAKEIEMSLLERTVGTAHSDWLSIRHQKNVISEKYFALLSATPEYDSISNKDIFMPIDQLPSIGLQYVRLFREVTLQEKILEFLLPQYEQAKIQEAKDTPTVQILDQARIPYKRSKPKRALMVIIASILSFGFGLMIVFFIEYMQKLKYSDPESNARFLEIIQSLKNDIPKFIKRNS
ncbi:hypothetical protein KAR48_07625 [bacterium]|nr:hypothetical protein [bacterium]